MKISLTPTSILGAIENLLHTTPKRLELRISLMPFTRSSIHLSWLSPPALSPFQTSSASGENIKLVTNKKSGASKYIPESVIIDSVCEIICTVDSAGRFMSISKACTELWGYQPQELEGRFFSDFILPEDTAKTRTIGSVAMSDGSKFTISNRYLHKDGRTIPMIWSVRWSAAYNAIFCVGRDAKDIEDCQDSMEALVKERTQALEQANKELEAFSYSLTMTVLMKALVEYLAQHASKRWRSVRVYPVSGIR